MRCASSSTLRDHLPVNNVAHLPLMMRGVLFEGWQPAKTPVHERTRDEFLMHVMDEFALTVEADPRQITTAVFRVLSTLITIGEAEIVRHALPNAIRQLWLDSLSGVPATPLLQQSRATHTRPIRNVRPEELEAWEEVIF